MHMKTKLIALLLLVVMTVSLASCSVMDKITGIFGGDDPATTTTASVTTTAGLSDPIRTEPAKSTTTAPQPATPADPWSPIIK